MDVSISIQFLNKWQTAYLITSSSYPEVSSFTHFCLFSLSDFSSGGKVFFHLFYQLPSSLNFQSRRVEHSAKIFFIKKFHGFELLYSLNSLYPIGEKMTQQTFTPETVKLKDLEEIQSCRNPAVVVVIIGKNWQIIKRSFFEILAKFK